MDISRRADLAYGFLHSMFGKIPKGWLTLWTLEKKEPFWFEVSDLKSAVDKAMNLSESRNVYFGLGTRKEKLPGKQRGRSVDIASIPCIWVEIDIKGGEHAAKNLPTVEEAKKILNTFPLEPSAVIHSGGGWHCYWQFDTAINITSKEDMSKASELLQNFQDSFMKYARSLNLHIDKTSDLARVLRIPGTYNRKAEPKLVEIIKMNDKRYTVEHVQAAIQTFSKTAAQRSSTDFPEQIEFTDNVVCLPDAKVGPIIKGCNFIKDYLEHIDQATYSEWLAALSIASFCEDYKKVCHDWSAEHSGYSSKETDQKIEEVRTNMKPRTCSSINAEFGGCNNCLYWGKIHSPIAIGMKNNEEWDPPIEFEDKNVPGFPANIFPEWIQNFIDDVAEATQTPRDMPSMAAFSVLSTALSKKFQMNIHGSWNEPLNTYLITLMAPANRKSAVYELLIRPISIYEKEIRQEMEVEVRHRASERIALKKEIEYLINTNAKKPDEKHKKKIRILNEELVKMPELSLPSFVLDDTTPEKLSQVLEENGEKVSILSSEGGIFEIIRGRYAKELNLDIFLKGHSEDRVRIDRKGFSGSKGTTVCIEKPALTIGIFAQPDVLQGLPRQFKGRGLMARFLYSLPKDFLGYRKVRPADIDPAVRSKYFENVKKLLKLGQESGVLGAESEGFRTLRLGDEADTLFTGLQSEIEERLREGNDLAEIPEWSGKFVGQMARLTGLLHVAKHIEGDMIPEQVEVDTVQAMLRLKEYFISHAKIAFGCMKSSEEEEDLKYLLSVIKRKAEQQHAIKAEKIFLDYREIQQSTKKRFTKTALLKDALHELEELNYLRKAKKDSKTVYEINPYVYKEKRSFSAHTQSHRFDVQQELISSEKAPQLQNGGNGGERDCEREHLESYNDREHNDMGELGEPYLKNNNDDEDLVL